MTFKESARHDIESIFLDPNEFGEPHKVNGKEGINIIIDDFELLNREKFRKEIKDDGTSLKRGIIYIKAVDFGRMPSVGKQILIDNRCFRVEAATNESGLYSITIKAVK